LSIKDKLIANLGWKVVAVLLALVLWFHVSTERTYEKYFQARIEPIGLSPRLKVDSLNPPTTKVSIIGTGKQILQLMVSGGVTAYVDLSMITRAGAYDHEVTPSDLYDIDISALRSVAFISNNHIKIDISSKQ
jgi:YbbR domain-containing protein